MKIDDDLMPPILSNVVEAIEALYAQDSPSDKTGISTGFTDLDMMISGFQDGDLIVIAGRPSMGKTSFAMNVAVNAALDSQKNIAIFGMEMPREKMAHRLLGAVGKFNYHDLITGRLQDDDWGRLTHALGELNDSPIRILSPSNPVWTAQQLREDVLDAEIDLLIVDGIHSLDVVKFTTAYDRNIQLGEQIRQLKKLALELNIPVVLTAPLNRELEGRPNKRPILKDLRDIGMLEDIADLVLFIYRDEIYDYDSADKGKAEIIIGKHRNGPLGRIDLAFRGEYCRFDNLASGNY